MPTLTMTDDERAKVVEAVRGAMPPAILDGLVREVLATAVSVAQQRAPTIASTCVCDAIAERVREQLAEPENAKVIDVAAKRAATELLARLPK